MRSALIGALILVTAACARPTSTQHQILPTPSPSPTPTTPLVLTATAPFHTGEVGVVYAPVALSATGGVQPYTWTISDGALPAGLTLPGSVPIAAALSVSLIPACATQCSVELGCVSVCGAFGAQSGGVEPYSYTLTSGTLPAGTALSGLSLSGTFVGLSGYLNFTVQVTDGFGATASVAVTFWMYDHISLAGGRCSYGVMPCTVRLPYSGGTPNVAASMNVDGWSGGNCGFTAVVICPEPPISASAGGGVVSITIGPMPPNSPYPHPTGTFTLSLTDADPCGPGAQCRSGGASLSLVYTG